MRRLLGTRGPRSCLTVALVTCLVGAVGASGSAAADDRTPRPDAGTKVLHRVVWDEFLSGRHGVHLWSADVDGSHAPPIYTSHRGFTTELTLDRSGRRVAFAPCCRDSLPKLVVVPVGGGRALEPLAHHPPFFFVGGIGWSPHGSRLVLEGEINRHHELTDGLWAVRPDGSGLHRLLRLPDPRIDDSGPNDALAWTRDGVMYCQAGKLRLAHHGHSRVLIRGGVYSVGISGDGRHIVTERYDRATVRSSIWYGDADGTHQRRLWLGPRSTTSRAPLFGEAIPDFHGRHLLTTRQDNADHGHDGIVGWRVGADPARAPVLDFLSNAFGYAWN